MSTVHIIEPGTYIDLHTGGDTIKARILSVTLDINGISNYRVCWWSGNDRKIADVEVHEISLRTTSLKFTPIGFAHEQS